MAQVASCREARFSLPSRFTRNSVGLVKFLFSEEDVYEPNFGGLVGEVEERLTNESLGGPKLRTTDDTPQTFQELLDWFKKNKADREFFGDAHTGTKGKLLRRLKYIVQEGDGVLRRTEPRGNPLKIPAAGIDGPIVIDLFAINSTASLQRFVVAAVLNRIIEFRSGKQVKGLRYLITLDELNRFAPKGGLDPITQQIEMVAAEMRSQGVILLGAQQQASLVSPRVIENSAVRASVAAARWSWGKTFGSSWGRRHGPRPLSFSPMRNCCINQVFASRCWQKSPFRRSH